MPQPLPLLFFDKQGGFAYAKLKLYAKAALRGERCELVRIEEPAEAQEVARSVPALCVLSAMGSAARGKYKETKSSGKASHVRERAAWKALGAFAPMQQQDKTSEEESPGCAGTYWKSPLGAWVCGVRHPLSTDFSQRGLTARWLRACALLGRGEIQLLRPVVFHNPPLERLWGDSLCAFDIETRGYTEEITYFALADADGAYSWDWTPEVAAAVRAWSQTSRPKVGQNSLKFDIGILERNLGCKFVGPLGDLMGLQSVYCRQHRYALQSIVSYYFPIAPWKAQFKSGESAEWEYNALDAGYTYYAAMHLHTKLGIPVTSGLPRMNLL